MRWKFSKIIFSRNYSVSSNFHGQLYHKNLYYSNLLKACPCLRSYGEIYLPQNFQCRSWSSDNFGKLKGAPPQQLKGHEQPSEVVDIDKELLRYDYEDVETYVEEDSASDDDTFLTEIKRGTTGVYDLEDLHAVLQSRGAQDICVIQIPIYLKYVDYMVIVTGRSTRHLKAMAEHIQYIFKKKRSATDKPTCAVEGLTSTDWLAMDLGNIALHLFLPGTRTKYDIESLWTVGPEYDDKVRDERLDTSFVFDNVGENEQPSLHSAPQSLAASYQQHADVWHCRPVPTESNT